MCEQTWTVIQFEEDCSVEAVPSTWIQGQFCHWPTYSQEKLMTAIRKHESLNTRWPCYKIRNFRNSTFEDYSKARSKARTAEVTSDLNSEIEENPKRKRIQKMFTSSEEDNNEDLETSLLSQPPILQTKTKIKQNNFSSLNKASSTSLNVNQSTYDESSYNTENNNSILSENVDSSRYYETTPVSTPCSSACSKKTAKNLVAQNYLIRSIVIDILSEVKEIKLQLKTNSQETSTKEKEEIISIFNNKDVHFPLKTEKDLQTVELILENDDEITKAMNELIQIGGNNGYEFIRRALSMMLTNEIADKYSFFGRKKKKSFCNLNICKLLISASQKGRYCETTKEAEKFIQGWLRRAAERGKLRK
ncbi:uncharacterized protein LOC105254819 isoform X2 [Camponotus floridanus]|uniref:uncharacterized protein LOC105254819 isoform X2 n=1 Tax=Camponotus floridanus TaxID=104421 RepID=UPI000DC67465|nr:uncharacterized protein LOC105254819 isoform X2 [Camponotus floridanus]